MKKEWKKNAFALIIIQGIWFSWNDFSGTNLIEYNHIKRSYFYACMHGIFMFYAYMVSILNWYMHGTIN